MRSSPTSNANSGSSSSVIASNFQRTAQRPDAHLLSNALQPLSLLLPAYLAPSDIIKLILCCVLLKSKFDLNSHAAGEAKKLFNALTAANTNEVQHFLKRVMVFSPKLLPSLVSSSEHKMGNILERYCAENSKVLSDLSMQLSTLLHSYYVDNAALSIANKKPFEAIDFLINAYHTSTRDCEKASLHYRIRMHERANGITEQQSKLQDRNEFQVIEIPSPKRTCTLL